MPFLGSDSHRITLPNITLLGNDIWGVLVVPQITLAAHDANGFANITVPNITVTANAVISTVWNMSAVLPMITLEASGVVGVTGVGNLTLPQITLEALMTRDSVGNIVVPIITLEASGSPEITWTGSIEVPMILLDASGSTLTTSTLAITDYEVWTMNSVTGAHTTYSSWPVNSYGLFNGVEIALLSDGVYELTGDHDVATDIAAVVEWPPTDMGSHKQKRIDSLSVNMRSLQTTTVAFTAIVDEQQTRRYLKTVTGRPEGMRQHRQLLPKGLNGQHWQFGFENTNGGDFVLDEIEVIPVELTRRFK